MELLSFLVFLVFGGHFFGLPFFACAQDAPVFIQGGFEDATVDDELLYNTGGTIKVNGFDMVVPKNVLVQFPAAWVPWKDFVASKADFAGFETLVLGNTINGVHRVAQVIIYEFFEGLASGFIESLDYADGSIKIQNGPTVRISDPNGVFSVGYDGAPFMTADDQSPSISSFSGFPMCIPRNDTDPLCPLSNRPFKGPGAFTAPDPIVMAPFQAGDFITFTGFRKGNEVIAFSIVAQNVQIQTLGDIVYVRMELGLLGIDNPNPNAEFADSRFIGFTSNNRATVALYAMDVDPCTGDATDRIIATMGLRGGRNEQNKFEYRNDILHSYTREYKVVAEINGVERTRMTKNGILSGTYVQPVNVWVQAEQNIPGTPPVPHDFSEMAFLTKGVGRDEDGNLWGPLDPFPQTGVFIEAPNCPTDGSASSNLARRGGVGLWYSRAKTQAVADAENKGTTAGFLEIAPSEGGNQTVKRVKREF
ncbi:Hypothetical protein NCS54_01388500 [Fusarium falciforme]|uniref:Hypothetical protein n=1 Tax=Fusarium falciforme TaxID=195108 RepID=UPI0023014494|nr:Hypothetical protein NCS54_01388500 [Fusarium falciforme]WAO96218.1 Hypothetical protein NCS54_01388500 [Fusarium falciforme]